MKKIRVAIVGYGNIGKYTLQALNAAPDFEVAGVVRRSGSENLPQELECYNVVKDIRELGDVDVAILSTPTRSVERYAKDILALGINTVDSFDIHSKILELRRSLGESAEAGNAVSIISAGWDPDAPRLTPGQMYFSPTLLQHPGEDTAEYYQRLLFSLRRAIHGRGENADPWIVAALAELAPLEETHTWLKEASPWH